ncbi:hypothetical protein RND71_026330 [Anisodus tanguticus]|uniref:AAA+ ATPase domain-containing protein n=1 Tax=Anisodus tanguticus TaxID=243964 RepID=A0AAE1RM43_9SOLA|nr:hypothetical protein RND71_026330 [Anisodus tanguticus]
MPSTTAVLSAYTTVTASAVLVRTLLYEVQNLTNQLLPRNLQEEFLSGIGYLVGNLSSQMSIIIEENNGLILNEVFEASKLYLVTIQSPSTQRLKVAKAEKKEKLSTIIGKDENISFGNENRLNLLLPCDLEVTCSSRGNILLQECKVILSTLGSYGESVYLDHPSTFETLAIDPKLKKELIDDLDRFVKRRDYYRRVGKAWKHGYLLYGPPGTGKSSLIAAMANYLKFDIYDMELSSLQSNGDLRRQLVYTKNRSILVIEDIDCSIELRNRNDAAYNQSQTQVTLSGLLNFIDGLWSSCGDERIIVFTTNYKDRLDPAFLRPGRMDMQIHMFYCSPSGFRILVSNYPGLKNHHKFDEIDELITEVNVTPAEIAEE